MKINIIKGDKTDKETTQKYNISSHMEHISM